MDDKELEALFGPAAAYSEHRRGETIKYREDGQTKEGVILWVCADGQAVEGGRRVFLQWCILVKS
jgi:hypothetical protein